MVGETAIAAAASATTTAAASTARPTRHRIAASAASPTSSAPMLDRDSVSTSATHRIASTTTVASCVRCLRAYSRTAPSRIITSARNRPKMSGSKNTELTVKYV